MSCPTLPELFEGLEIHSPEIEAHLTACPRCRERAGVERQLTEALVRLRDPAPPAELLQGVLSRIAAVDRERRGARRQLAIALAVSAALATAALALLWPASLADSLIDLRELATSGGIAIGALHRALGSWLKPLAVTLLAAEAVAAVVLSLLFHEFLTARRVRS